MTPIVWTGTYGSATTRRSGSLGRWPTGGASTFRRYSGRQTTRQRRARPGPASVAHRSAPPAIQPAAAPRPRGPPPGETAGGPPTQPRGPPFPPPRRRGGPLRDPVVAFPPPPPPPQPPDVVPEAPFRLLVEGAPDAILLVRDERILY